MKILALECTRFELFKKFLSEFDVRCPEDADDSFLEEVEIVLAHSWKKLEKFIPKLKNLKMIQAFTAGIDHFDFSKIPREVLVCTNAGSNSWGVAEHTVSLIFAALKHTIYRHNMMMQGEFPQMLESRLLRGKTVGFIGLGNIARDLVKMLDGFLPRFMGISKSGNCSFCENFIFVGKIEQVDFLLANSDIVIIAAPLTADTFKLINKDKLKLMKRNAIIVNIARGKIIAEEDLYNHLLENPEFIAALDVWWHYGNGFKQQFPFENLPNVILSPHCAGSYEGFWEDMTISAANNIKAYIHGKPRNIVNKNGMVC